jgi:hypothetical protein
MRRLLIPAIVLSLFLMSGVAHAGSLFNLKITSYMEGYSAGYDTADDLFDGLHSGNLMKFVPMYDGMSQLDARLDFRGILVYANFWDMSPVLTINIPSLNLEKQFTGATRDESVHLLEEWFKHNGGGILDSLMKTLVATTPTDPIAGNPNSLMANEVSTAYEAGFNSVASSQGGTGEARPGQKAGNQIFIGGTYSAFRSGEIESDKISLPLSYTFRSESDQNKRLNIRVPINYIRIESAEVFNVGIGMGLTYPVLDFWLITPGIDYAVVFSEDLGSAGQVITGSLTSALLFDIGSSRLSIGNMFAYGTTLEFSYDGYDYNPDIESYVFRNGIIYMIPTDALMEFTSLELFVVDTRFLGSDLYIDNYQEAGFSYGFRTDIPDSGSVITDIFQSIRLGVTYLYNKDYDGIKANMGFTF